MESDDSKVNLKDSAVESGNDYDSQYPLIFRCINCSMIVGDSTSWTSTNDNLRTITLTRVTSNVQKSQSLAFSSNVEDMGSTYYILKCEKCKEDIGRMYLATPCYLDEIRNLYTFDVKKIDTYQVGSKEQGEEIKSNDILIPDARTVLSKFMKLDKTIARLDKHVLLLENRISCVENFVKMKFGVKLDSMKSSDDNGLTVPLTPGNSDTHKSGQSTETLNATETASLKRKVSTRFCGTHSPKTKREKLK